MAMALDSNFLLRYVQREHPLHEIARDAARHFVSTGEELVLLPQVITEFWCVATRPASARGGFGLTPVQADHQVRLLERIFTIRHDTPAVYDTWRQIVVFYSVSGVQTYDARIAAALQVHSIDQLLTFNGTDFARYDWLTAVDPEAY